MKPFNPDSLTKTQLATGVVPALNPRRGRRSGLVLLILAGLAVVGGIIFGLYTRSRAYAELVQTTKSLSAVPVVDIVQPALGASNIPIILPGRVEAFIETPIHARTNGYLKAWYFDIGAAVKKGDLLAEIETPEVDRQLQQSRADLITAQANLSLSQLTADRAQNLFRTQSVSAQERDNAAGTLAANKAVVASKQADVARLEQLQSYEKIRAPFDEIITVRNTNIGVLVAAGATSPASELFHLASLDKVRVFIAVPEIYAPAARPGVTAALSLDEYPNETFPGTIVRTANAIDPVSRTLLCEVDAPNPQNRLLPGAYALVHLDIKSDKPALTVPSNTLLFRSEGLTVATVQNDAIRLTPVTIGRDFGDRVEITSGLAATDSVVLNPTNSVTDGTPVRIKQTAKVAKNP